MVDVGRWDGCKYTMYLLALDPKSVSWGGHGHNSYAADWSCKWKLTHTQFYSRYQSHSHLGGRSTTSHGNSTSQKVILHLETFSWTEGNKRPLGQVKCVFLRWRKQSLADYVNIPLGKQPWPGVSSCLGDSPLWKDVSLCLREQLVWKDLSSCLAKAILGWNSLSHQMASKHLRKRLLHSLKWRPGFESCADLGNKRMGQIIAGPALCHKSYHGLVCWLCCTSAAPTAEDQWMCLLHCHQ